MAKTQTFGDKAKKVKSTGVNLKIIRAVRNEAGNVKFHETFVRLDDIAKVTGIK
ncbi:MAG: hypothetical protein WCJ01_07290 [Ignavibacteria bacterium]